MLTVSCCLVLELGLGLRLDLDLVIGYTHVFIQLSVVVVPYHSVSGQH